MKYYGLIDHEGSIRFIFPYIEWAFKKRQELGWGKVFEIKCEIIGEEYL